MGVRFASEFSNTIANLLPSSATNTAIYITPPLTLAADNAQVYIAWFTCIVTGTGTTSLVFQIYRFATISGLKIGAQSWAQTVVAGNTYLVSGSYIDQPGAADLYYTLAVIQNGVSAAGTLSDGCLLAFVL